MVILWQYKYLKEGYGAHACVLPFYKFLPAVFQILLDVPCAIKLMRLFERIIFIYNSKFYIAYLASYIIRYLVKFLENKLRTKSFKNIL